MGNQPFTIVRGRIALRAYRDRWHLYLYSVWGLFLRSSPRCQKRPDPYRDMLEKILVILAQTYNRHDFNHSFIWDIGGLPRSSRVGYRLPSKEHGARWTTLGRDVYKRQTNESKNARCFCWIYLICLNAFPSISVMSLAIMLSSERKAAARSPAVPCKNTPTCLLYTSRCV